MSVITAEGLVKIYRSRAGEVRALDGLDLTVEEGSVLGLLKRFTPLANRGGKYVHHRS